jgi:chitodextrinase
MRRLRRAVHGVAAALLGAALAAAPPSAATGAAAAGLTEPLPAPTELVVTGYGTSATLSWRQPPGPRAQSFRVYDRGQEVARNTTTSVHLTNLGFSNTHTYTVTAVDKAGRESAPSEPLTRTLGVSGVPPQCLPSWLTGLTVSQVTPTAATLTWVNTGDRGTTTVTGGPAGPVSTEASGVRIGGLTPGTTYTLEVSRRPYCSGPSAPATTVTVTTPGGTAGTPAAPGAVTVADRTDTTVTLAWQPPAGGSPATRYAVYESGRRLATTSSTSATVRGLYHAAAYTFEVTALAAGGGESTAASVLATTAACQARPPRPAPLTATALSASSVRLDWTYDAAAQSYTVYAGGAALGTSTGTAVVVGGLAPATSYRFQVAATLTNGCGTSPRGSWLSVTTPPGPPGRPGQPTDLRVVAGDPVTATVTLRWSQPPGQEPAVAYRIYQDAQVIATSDVTSVTLALPRATTQVLAVAAVSAEGQESAHSAPVTVQVPYLPPPMPPPPPPGPTPPPAQR